MKIIGKKLYKFLFIIIIVCLYTNLNSSKPMQMDELSTFNHCAGKTWSDLVLSTKIGVDWMPITYFSFFWFIDQFVDIDKNILRIPSFICVILSVFLLHYSLKIILDKESSMLGVMLVFSHSILVPFISAEARPYGLYLFVNTCLFYYFIKIILNENKRFYFGLFILCFLSPSIFYFSGVYCFIFFLSFIIYSTFYRQHNLHSFILSSMTGFLLFIVFLFPTFLTQIDQTYAGINSNSILTKDLYSFYGNFIIFPFGIFFIFLFHLLKISSNSCITFINKESSLILNKQKAVLCLSIFWLMVPLAFFVIGRFLELNFLQSRYHVPILISFSTLISFIIYRFKIKYKFSYYQKLLFYFYCLFILFFTSNSLAKAYNSNSLKDSLDFIKDYSQPIVTANMHAAFHLTYYHNNPVYFIVSDDSYRKYINKFSSKYTTLSLSSDSDNYHISKINHLNNFIFILGSIPFDIISFAKNNNFNIKRSLILNTQELQKVFFLEKNISH